MKKYEELKKEYHEAGHALFDLDQPNEYCHFVWTRPYILNYIPAYIHKDSPFLADKVMKLLAGYLAGEMFMKYPSKIGSYNIHNIEESYDRESFDDIDEVWVKIYVHCENDPEESRLYFMEMVEKTFNHLLYNWDTVQTIAIQTIAERKTKKWKRYLKD